MEVKIEVLEGGKAPEYKRVGDACMDCYAHLKKPVWLFRWGKTKKIPLGFKLDIPWGYEAETRSRSGNSLDDLKVDFGCIDQTFTGELNAILWTRKLFYKVKPGDRVCQLKLLPTTFVQWEQVPKITKETIRGSNGFGSSGKN